MPVIFDSSAANGLAVSGATTSGSVSATHNVSTIARPNTVALVGLLWTGGVNVSASTFGATFGGVAMTQLGSTQYADSNEQMMKWFYLANPLTGPRTVTGTFASVTGEVAPRAFFLVSATYAGVDITTTPTPVQASGASTTNNSVTVSSVLPAHRVVTLHSVGSFRQFTNSFNQSKRAIQTLFASGSLLLGDAPGAASVTATAVHSASTPDWLAAGITLVPSIVDASASLGIPVSVISGGGTYRQATPAPDRTWVIPADPPLY